MNAGSILISGCSQTFRRAAASALRAAAFNVTESMEIKDISRICRQATIGLLITDFSDFIRHEITAGNDDPCLGVPRIYVSPDAADIPEMSGMPNVVGWLVEPTSARQIVLSAAVGLNVARHFSELIESVNHLQRAMAQRREISIATGVIMERFRVDQDQAFDIVRRKARSSRRKLADVAVDLIRAFYLLSSDAAGSMDETTRAARPKRAG